MIAGTGLAYFLVNRPPPEDPVVRVAFTPLPASSQIIMGIENLYSRSDTGEGPAANYLVSVPDAGEAVDVLGVSGPGLAAPQLPTPHSRSAVLGHSAQVTLAAAFDCAQPGWWSGTDGDYRVNVARTDRYGRVLHAFVPLPVTAAAAWREVLQRSCVYTVMTASTFDQWTVTPQPATRTMRLSVHVRNSAEFPIFLQFAFPTAPLGTARVARVPAHGQAVLRTEWPADLCDFYPWALLAQSTPDDPNFNVVLVNAGVQNFSADHRGQGFNPYQNAISIPHTLRVRLQHELDDACRNESTQG